MKIDLRDCKYRLENQNPKLKLIFTIVESNLKIVLDKWIYICYLVERLRNKKKA